MSQFSGSDTGDDRSERLPSEVIGLNNGVLMSELLFESVSKLDEPELRLLGDSNSNPDKLPEAISSSP